jgi:hypothetical protein
MGKAGCIGNEGKKTNFSPTTATAIVAVVANLGNEVLMASTEPCVAQKNIAKDSPCCVDCQQNIVCL